MSKKVTVKQARNELWHLGNLEWKLKGIQLEMRDAVYNSKGKKTVFLVSRRSGKSFTMMTIATEYCIKNPNSIVKVLFPKKKDAKSIARDQMKVILEDCPPDIVPEWKEADKIFIFPNGSEIQMAGTDGGSADSVRGSRCHLAILDEAGFHSYNDFTYIVNSIIMPTLLTTNGKMILASTPSREPDHPFMVDYVAPAKRDGSIIEYDIFSNPMISQNDIEEIASEYPGGFEDPDFQREFLLKTDVIADDLVVPEFTKDLQEDIIKTCSQRPSFYDIYVSGDPAVDDLTVILFSYYDYLKQQIVICDELVMGGDPNYPLTTQDIADGIKRKESLLFRNALTGEVKEPTLRIMDNNNKILINDLFIEHGLNFFATAKDDKLAQINKVRMMLKQGRIIIDPKCKTLIYHLQTARWKMSSTGVKTTFQRNKGDKSIGHKPHHADGVDALIYLVRNVDLNKNPYPGDYFDLKGENVFASKAIDGRNQGIAETVKKMFNLKKN